MARIHFGYMLALGVILAPARVSWSSAPSIPDSRVIEVAICLDTSESMESLIDSARLQLWSIVDELLRAEPRPRLRVALLTYGNSANDSASGWVRVELPLTENLDRVSERLFELTASGGDEYVARVLQVALEELNWDESYDALKLIVVGGNEAADQDPLVDVLSASEDAMRRDVVVSTIFFGSDQSEDLGPWQDVAQLGGGAFASVGANQPAMVSLTPFDVELANLGAELSETYIPLGEEGWNACEALIAQDQNSSSLDPSVAATRAEVKASSPPDWDLVGRLDSGTLALADLDWTLLPPSYRHLTIPELEALVGDMHYRREELQQKIAEVGFERRESLASRDEGAGGDAPPSFESAVTVAVCAKAEEKGFYFPER